MSNDYFKAQGWFKNYARSSEDSRGMFQRLVKEDEEAFRLASAESDKIKNMMNKKFGSGTMKYGSELPPIQNPFKDFEARNPAAEGGMIGRINFGNGGSFRNVDGSYKPINFAGKKISFPNSWRASDDLKYTYGQVEASIRNDSKKLNKWLKSPTPQNWIKLGLSKSQFARNLRAYLLDQPIDPRKGTGLDKASKELFDQINIKKLFKLSDINKINQLTTGGKGKSLKSIAAKTFGNQKFTMAEQIETIKNFQNGEQWLKRNSNPDAVDADGKNIYRKYANAIKSMQSEQSRIGGFPFGDNSEKKLWSNLYRSSYRGDRIIIAGEFADGNLPINKDGKVDWKMVDKNGVPAWKRVQFVDLEAPKNTTFTWGGDFKKGDFAKQIDNTFGEGFFKKSTAAYDTQIKTGSKRLSSGETIKSDVKVRLLTAEALAENPNATKKQIDAYIKRKSPRFNITEVHHPDGVGKNPYKTEPVFKYANSEVGKVESSLKAGKITQAEAKIRIDKINKDIGPVRIKLDDGYYGNYKNTQKSIVEAGNTYIDKLESYITDKTGTVKQPMLSSGLSGAYEMMSDDLKAIVNSDGFKKFANSKAGKTLSMAAKTPGKLFGVGDVLLGYLDYTNNEPMMSKAKAYQSMLQAMSFNLYKGGDRQNLEEIKAKFIENGGDGKIFDQVVDLNKSNFKMKEYIENIKRSYKDLSSAGYEDTAKKQMKSALNNVKTMGEKNLDKFEQYKTDLAVSESGGPIQIKDITQPIKDTKKAAFDLFEEEQIKNFPTTSKQVNTERGPIGNKIFNSIFTKDSYKKLLPQNFLSTFNQMIPFMDYKPVTEKEKEQALIDNMEPRERYLYNLARGQDPDNPITINETANFMDKNKKAIGFAEGGITGLRSKYEYKK